MGKGNLWHRKGSGHHCGLLSTGSGEFSIELTLNYSQAILVSLPMPYNGDDQSGCHSWTEEKTKPQMLLVAQRETRPGDGGLAERNTHCCKCSESRRRVRSVFPRRRRREGQTETRLNPLDFGKSKSFFLSTDDELRSR